MPMGAGVGLGRRRQRATKRASLPHGRTASACLASQQQRTWQSGAAAAERGGAMAETGGDLAAQVEALTQEKAALAAENDMSKKKFMAAVKKMKRDEAVSKEATKALEDKLAELEAQLSGSGGGGGGDSHDAAAVEQKEAGLQAMAEERSALKAELAKATAGLEEATGKADAVAQLRKELDFSVGQLKEQERRATALNTVLERKDAQTREDRRDAERLKVAHTAFSPF